MATSLWRRTTQSLLTLTLLLGLTGCGMNNIPTLDEQVKASWGQVENQYQRRADQQFLALQAQLEGTENRISVARRDYIEAVRQFNTEIRTFPGVIWSKLLYSDLEAKPSFSAKPGADEAPKVSFQ